MLSVCLGNFTGERVKKIAGRKKLILAPRSCSQNISGEEGKEKGEGREGSRDRSTYLRGGLRDKTSGKSKIKGKKVTRYS